MKHLSLWVALGIFSLLAAVGSASWPHAQERGDQLFSGGSYLTTIQDSAGNFASRSVVTLHADQTMLAVDSSEEGPNDYFGNQLGTWKPAGNHRIVCRAINFRYPHSPGPGIARSEYVISFAPDRRQVTGTITLRTFPLEDGNPLEDEGTLIGTFTFQGEWIKP
jgi:hypothetical protein